MTQLSEVQALELTCSIDPLLQEDRLWQKWQALLSHALVCTLLSS